MLKRVASSVNVFLIILLALTVQADDVSIKNPTDEPFQFRVIVPSTGYDRIITLQPWETQNAIGTDLWHNAVVKIIGLAAEPDDSCGLVINEIDVIPNKLDDFYLPKMTLLPPYRGCPYISNLPRDCDCSNIGGSYKCEVDCKEIMNAQVVVEH